MSWDQHHSRSERLAAEAELALRSGDSMRATALYRDSAEAEQRAAESLPNEKLRTRGITTVSAMALWYKASDYAAAERLACGALSSGGLPPSAEARLRELLGLVWVARDAEQAGVRFVAGDVLVSVRGGQVIHGGAPLDLIIRKVEGIQSIMLRTIEMMLGRPFRRRGGPSSELLEMFRPWLIQAPAGSYQFAVRVQEPAQQEIWAGDKPQLTSVTKTFFSVLRASAENPERELPPVVPDQEYRGAFLSLSRNLAPTGKAYEWLEVRDAAAPAEASVLFGTDTRLLINDTIRVSKPTRTEATDEPAAIAGILRAVHLDQDWLEVATTDVPARHLKIVDAGDALDDVVGPMVNRPVIVMVTRRGQRLLYRDIELQE